MKILMVCLGNICRSPLAEGVLKHKAEEAGLHWQIDSAGTNGYHVGEAPHHLSQKVAGLNGIDICDQRARQFVKEDFDRYDKIYAMADDVVDDIKRIAKNKYDPSKLDLFLNELYPGKKYNNRLCMALGISLSAALLLFILLPVNHSKKILAGINYSDSVVLKIIDLPKDIQKIIPPKPKEVVQQQVRQKQFVTMIISKKETIIPPPDIRDLLNTDISDKTLDGRPSTGIAVVQPTVIPNTGSGEQKTVSEFKPDQKEPEFPGGAEAWLKFLRKNLVAPEEIEAGEKKTVLIRFFVATDGAVTGFEVLQSAGRSFDNEVIRVLRKMPKWKPAIQNGQPVEKAFTQPVTFVGVEE